MPLDNPDHQSLSRIETTILGILADQMDVVQLAHKVSNKLSRRIYTAQAFNIVEALEKRGLVASTERKDPETGIRWRFYHKLKI